MQTENPVYEEIEEILRGVDLPRGALVEQRVETPPSLTDIRGSVREALNSVELPSGSVAIGVGSRGVARIEEVVAALVEVLKEGGAEPFVVPAMGSHGASTAEGQARVLAHLGVSEERVGCPVRATMETVKIGETPAGVAVFMDQNAYEADSVIVVNRVKPHTAFRGTVESGPTKMLAIGLGKQRGAHSIHSAGWEEIHRTIPEAARVAVETGKVAFGLATVENADEEPCKVVAIPAADLEAGEAPLLEEAKRNLARLPFDDMDVLVVDEIGKNVSGDGADPNVTGRYPTTAASGRTEGRAHGLPRPHGGDRRQRQRPRHGRRGHRAPRRRYGPAIDVHERAHFNDAAARKDPDDHAHGRDGDSRRPDHVRRSNTVRGTPRPHPEHPQAGPDMGLRGVAGRSGGRREARGCGRARALALRRRLGLGLGNLSRQTLPLRRRVSALLHGGKFVRRFEGCRV